MGKKVIAALVGVEKSAVPPALMGEQVIDLAGDPRAYWHLKEGLKRAGLDPTTFPFDPSRPPYPGFAYLDEEQDAAVFFGRDAQSCAASTRSAGSRAPASRACSSSWAIVELEQL